MGILRFLLAISVLISHSEPIFGFQLIGGSVAVQSFYIISGFYMALVIEGKYSNNLKSFYWNRFVKIFPVYWIILVLSILFNLLIWIKFHPENNIFSYYQKLLESSQNHCTIFLLILVQLILIGTEFTLFFSISKKGNLEYIPDYRLAQNPKTHHFLFIPQSWSLSLELLFYFFVPFLNKLNSRILIIIFLGLIILRYGFYSFSGLNHDPWTYRFFPFELALFILGMLSYRLGNWRLFQYNKKIGIAFLAIIFIWMLTFSRNPFICKMEFFYLLLIISLPFLFKTFESKVFQFIGELSFPLYLVHILVLDIVKALHLPFRGLTCLLLSILLAIIIQIFYKKIIERFKKNSKLAL